MYHTEVPDVSRLFGIRSIGHVNFDDLLVIDMTSQDMVGLKENNFEEMEQVANPVVGNEVEVLMIP